MFVRGRVQTGFVMGNAAGLPEARLRTNVGLARVHLQVRAARSHVPEPLAARVFPQPRFAASLLSAATSSSESSRQAPGSSPSTLRPA